MAGCPQVASPLPAPATAYPVGSGAENSNNLLQMEAPKRATKFAANDEWGKVYRKAFGVKETTQGLSILTGATAGATEAFVVVPFELVKIRLQDKASAGKYSGAGDALVKIVKAEGLLSLYNGLESTMWRHILWNAGVSSSKSPG